jgi:hypothetical protein
MKRLSQPSSFARLLLSTIVFDFSRSVFLFIYCKLDLMQDLVIFCCRETVAAAPAPSGAQLSVNSFSANSATFCLDQTCAASPPPPPHTPAAALTTVCQVLAGISG